MERDPDAFESLFADVPAGSVAQCLRQVLISRVNLMDGPSASTCVSTSNSLGRDCFRLALLNSKIVTSLTSEDSLFVSLIC